MIRAATAMTAMLLAAAALLGAGCGGGESPAAGGGDHDHGSAPTASAPGKLTADGFAGTPAKPRKRAPALALEDSFGRRVDLGQFRGKAVIVTFLYVNCPDVCPLILGNLDQAHADLGPKAKDLQILAVSVDPEGDTRTRVNAFLKGQGVTRQARYLIGSRAELERVWSDWGIISKRSPKRDDPHFIEHSALVYGIDASGRVTTLYPTSLEPDQIVHDVPILASQ